MRSYRSLIILGLFLILIGCGANSGTDSVNDNGNKYSKLSTNESLDQQYSIRAKEILNNHQELTSINAVNTSKSIVIGLEVTQFERLKLEKIRKKVNKQMKIEFPNLDVVVSTDKKINLEVNRLEEKIQSNNITKKKVDKKINDLIKLAKDQA